MPAPKTGYAAGAALRPFFTGAAARLSPDGSCLAATCGEEAHVVDSRGGGLLAVLEGDSEPLTALAFGCDAPRFTPWRRLTPRRLDSMTLYTASRSMQCRRWELGEATAGAAAAAEPGEPPPPPLVARCARVWKAHPLPVNDMQVDSTGGLLARGPAVAPPCLTPPSGHRQRGPQRSGMGCKPGLRHARAQGPLRACARSPLPPRLCSPAPLQRQRGRLGAPPRPGALSQRLS